MRNLQIALALAIKAAMTAIGVYGCWLGVRLAKRVLLAVAFCAVGSAAITLDTTVNATTSLGSGATGVTWTHTVGTGANAALFIILIGCCSGPVTSASVLVDGIESPALISSGSGNTAWVWKLVNPPRGAHTIALTWPSTVNSYDGWSASSVSFFGVNQEYPASAVSPAVDAFVNTTSVTTATVTTTVAGDWLLGGAVAGSATLTAATGQTVFQNRGGGVVDGAFGHVSEAYLGPVSAGSNTMTWTNGASPVVVVLVAIHPFLGNVTMSGSPALPLPSQVRPGETSGWQVPANSGGDTQFSTWTSAATRAGNWGGGSIVSSYNDGTGFGCSSPSICLYEITAYNPAVPSATFSVVNTMTSYGGAAAQSCYDAVHQMKSRKPFAFNTVIFLPILCMSSGAGSSATSQTIGTGSKTFATQAALTDTAGDSVQVTGANPANFMIGTITSYSGTTMVINVTSTGGSGTFASWTITEVGQSPGGFDAFQSGYVVSPNGGTNWCNYLTFQTGSVPSGPNTCDVNNWKANGDNPVGASGFQFPLTTTNKMTRMQIVDFLCQDNSVNCPVAPGVDPAYLYFMTVHSLGGSQYVIRIPKSGGWRGVMLMTGAQAYNAGTWDSTLQNATAIASPAIVGCCGSISYLKDFGVFAVWSHSGSVAAPFATATTPWGTWTQTANLVSSTALIGFPSPVPGLCPKYVAGRVTCTVGSSPNTQLNLMEFDLGAQRPVWGGVQ